jgi:hypothetical protein
MLCWSVCLYPSSPVAPNKPFRAVVPPLPDIQANTNAGLGVAFRDNTFRQSKGKFYPIVGLKKPGDHIFANFGQLPFHFDIDGYVRVRQASILSFIIRLFELLFLQQHVCI